MRRVPGNQRFAITVRYCCSTLFAFAEKLDERDIVDPQPRAQSDHVAIEFGNLPKRHVFHSLRHMASVLECGSKYFLRKFGIPLRYRTDENHLRTESGQFSYQSLQLFYNIQ